MNKKLNNRFWLVIVDFITINLAFILFFQLKIKSGIWQNITNPDFFAPLLIIYIYWLIIFSFWGLYTKVFTVSRLDEITKLFKTTFFGVFLIFFVIFLDDSINSVSSSQRYIIFFYWLLLFLFTSVGRLIFRTYNRYLISKGIGNLNTIIVGFNNKSKEVADQISSYKALGLRIIGFVELDKNLVGQTYKDKKVLDVVENIADVVRENNISEIIISLEKQQHEEMLRVLSLCDIKNVSLKIVPDLYEIISGQARTSQVYGVPLIDVMPQLMPEWEKKVKRIMDVVVSAIILVLSVPVIIITAILIKLESKGPVLFKQIRAGKDGKEFNMYKFRSMYQDAEKNTGPVWSSKNDPRITKVGRFIRKVRIDEIPQFVNVLRGEMSLVGPRPERPYFVEKLSKEIPFYKRRLNVRPGITGWAQVKHKYDETIEDVKKKVQYDLFYIENASLKMDLSILFRTVFVVLFGKGHYE